MPESLLSFVLARLDEVEAPAFLHQEFERFPSADLATLVSEGILRETSEAEEIPRPKRYPGGGYVVVRHTARGRFGVAPKDEQYFAPLPLSEDDARQYEVSLPKLVERFRRDNEVDGVGFEIHEGVVPVGRKAIGAWGSADIYMSLPAGDEAELLATCLLLQSQSGSQRVILVTPRARPLSPAGRAVVNTTGVLLASMDEAARTGRLVLSWSAIVGSPAIGLQQAYPRDMRLFQLSGDGWLVGFEGLLKVVKGSIGMSYIKVLLESPGVAFKAADLSEAVSGTRRASILESAGDVESLSPEEVAVYKTAIASTDREIADAEAQGESSRVRDLKQKRALYVSEVRRARRLPSSESPERKRPRQSVSKAIKDALRKLEKMHPPIWRHLQSTLKLGATVLYQEDPALRWTT